MRRKWESTAVSIRSQGMGKRAMAWLHTHTHRCLQLRKTALNIGGSTVAGTKNLHRLSKACLSGKNTALQLQKSHFQAPNQTSARDSRIPLLGHKCTTASEFGSATRHWCYKSGALLEHVLSSKFQLTTATLPYSTTSVLVQILATINGSLPRCSAKHSSLRRAGQNNGLLWKQGKRQGQTSKADLSFCIRKLGETVSCILTSFLQGLFRSTPGHSSPL